jgi:hypothetical protein
MYNFHLYLNDFRDCDRLHLIGSQTPPSRKVPRLSFSIPSAMLHHTCKQVVQTPDTRYLHYTSSRHRVPVFHPANYTSRDSVYYPAFPLQQVQPTDVASSDPCLA